MIRVRIDDDFEDHPKVEPLSDQAHRRRLRGGCWRRKKTTRRPGRLVSAGKAERRQP